MKRFAVIIIALLSFVVTNAQTIALGERTPRLKDVKWLNGNIPAKSKYTYIGFVHSASRPCQYWAEQVYSDIANVEDVAFVLVSRESASNIEQWVMEYLSPRSGVIIEGEHLHSTFGVNYVPYAVIVDNKRRALWFGNPRMLDENRLERIFTNSQSK